MKKLVFFCAIFSTCLFDSFSQENAKEIFSESTFSGLKIRNIGPALMSGRISDIVLHPDNPNTWYVAVGSGGVWKTVNAGTTWEPIFDDQGSYSIGCLAIDKNNPHIVWVGTGENVGGRHVAYGDGIYKSSDGGKSWQNMGLKKSYHISKILIHPKNPDIIWVAAQGMLWNKGDERGVYKSTDGGKTWKKTLGDDEWTGATDIVIDPRDPDMLYAATWQRHRTVAAYMGGGPGSGIHKSTDGGETWRELTKGLPESNMGKIGLAISPQYPDVIYAAIELDRRTGGVYRSADRGESWIKQSEAVSGGTGPHYYQELYASPHNFDRLYLVDVRMQVSEDGGKTFTRMKEEFKHPDNHSLTFRDDDPDYLLVGTDGGIYESFDLGESWRFIPNLPVTQFYKVAVDDAEPFYNVYGGTQDNNTQGGPSRTDNHHGIRNADWFIILFGDGHQPATEPGNPDIVYAEWQEGNLVRVDRKTGEIVYVQPQPDEGEPHERFNWDAPILVSPHSPTRLYYASYRVWRSDNRGDSWKTISDDLTRGQERITLPIMGKQQSWDEPWDLYAMSNYNTITSLAESPLQEGLIYAGTDDGIIQVTEDGGENWRKIEVGSMPGVPATAFVNDIKADLFDVNTVYICLDNHKFGDLQPYIMKSTDKGKSWKSIRGNIPDRTLTWRMVQDHVKPELLFAGTEFGIYFTIDGGKKWAKLSGDVPVISFRDLAIQRRENDLVGASFGRGFFIF
ncbi:MAG: WD40/YVTN/BNR-like repeat-containing protein, partial [Bacteroidales bacterium]